MPYLDTSLLGSYYCAERLSPAVNTLITGMDDPVISPLVDLEFHSLISLKVRTREMTRTGAQAVLTQFRSHLSGGYYRVLDVGPREYDTARTWMAGLSTSLRTLDALHLACAFVHGEAIWTSHKPLAQAADALGVEHKLVTARQ